MTIPAYLPDLVRAAIASTKQREAACEREIANAQRAIAQLADQAEDSDTPVVVPVREDDSASTTLAEVAATARALKNPRIVYVDDEVENCLTFAFVFDGQFQILTVQDPRQALELIQRLNVDLAVVDQRMPEIDGLALAAQIHAQRHDLPIVLCSAYTPPAAIEAAKRAGIIREFIQKPWNEDQVLDLFCRLLKIDRPEFATA